MMCYDLGNVVLAFMGGMLVQTILLLGYSLLSESEDPGRDA